jgi:hypothetical protein
LGKLLQSYTFSLREQVSRPFKKNFQDLTALLFYRRTAWSRATYLTLLAPSLPSGLCSMGRLLIVEYRQGTRHADVDTVEDRDGVIVT